VKCSRVNGCQDGIGSELRCDEYRVIGAGAASQIARDLLPDAAHFLGSSVECARELVSVAVNMDGIPHPGWRALISLLNLSGQCQNRE